MLVTFIRHGESTDNLIAIWAGWRDAPLSNHGMNQAIALGQHWKDTPITAVYCSDLKRAHTTAQQLVAARAQDTTTPTETGDKDDTQLPLTVNPLLREQNFGIAEGKPWVARKPNATKDPNETEEEVYYTIYNRHEKFPDGESLDDLANRVEKALDETVWPHVQEALKSGEHEDIHIVVVSHGLAISELVAALLRQSPIPPASGKSYTGLVNTGWTQLQIDIESISSDQPEERIVTRIFVKSVNNSPHLAIVRRQGGGIGSAAHDETQKSIRDYFGGKATVTSKQAADKDTSSS
ncbi:phosphoglycerate mutase-like protein [Serendipita vermifera]|nr:phosphoglycerate mutase-like protein [Serendipita vermifera]